VVARWAEQTPPGFVFAVKVSRYVTHVKRLREALTLGQCAQMIETIRGAGYRLTQHAQAVSA